MVERDEMRMRLEGARDKRWAAVRMERLVGVPYAAAWLRKVTLSDPTRMSGAERAAAMRFSVTGLTDRERAELFGALFPRMAKVVERAWQDMACATLDRGQGLAFRAPGHVAATRAVRETWFGQMVKELEGHDPDVEWLASNAGYLGYFGGLAASRLLSAAINLGGELGEAVLETLRATSTGERGPGSMGRHVICGLLWSERPEAWEVVVKLLLAAQREEGLRQSILELAHTGHPGAFARVLEVVDAEDLVRFAATVRAVDVWLGLGWDSASTGVVRSTIQQVRGLLASEAARRAAIGGADAEAAYYGLWCAAVGDAQAAVRLATEMSAEKSPARRWVGVTMLGMIGLPEGVPALVRALKDEDWAVVAAAVQGLAVQPVWEFWLDDVANADDAVVAEAMLESGDAEARVESLLGLLGRMDKAEVKFKPPVFAWGPTTLKAAAVGRQLVHSCPARLGERLLDVVDRLDASTRYVMVLRWRANAAGGNVWPFAREKPSEPPPPLSPAVRRLMIRSLADGSVMVRTEAGERLGYEKLSDEEAAQHEALLERKAADIRTRAVARLLTADDATVLATAERLLGRGGASARGGVELLGAMVESKRAVSAARALLEGCAGGSQSKASGRVAAEAEAVLRPAVEWTAADAFGLAKGFKARPLPEIKAKGPLTDSAAALACLASLDDLVAANKTMLLQPPKGEGDAEDGVVREPLLLGGEVGMGLFGPGGRDDAAEAEKFEQVRGLLEEWEKQRGKDTRDRDGREILRAWMMLERMRDADRTNTVTAEGTVFGLLKKRLSRKINYPDAVGVLVAWLVRTSKADAPGYFLDGLEAALKQGDVGRRRDYDFAPSLSQPGLSVRGWMARMDQCRSVPAAAWTLEHRRRREGLVRAVLAAVAAGKAKDLSAEDLGPLQPGFDDAEALWRAGEVSDDEMLVLLCWHSPDWERRYGRAAEHLHDVLRRRLKRRSTKTATVSTAAEMQASARLDGLAEKIRRKVLEIEFVRGDRVTVATPLVFSLEPSGGIDAAIGAMAALGEEALQRRQGYKDWSKQAAMTHVVRESRPGPEDTPEAFAKAAEAAGLSDERLVALAVFQPRWAEHAEKATGWVGLEDAVLWVRAHTKGRTEIDTTDDLEEAWEGKAAERTPITPGSLRDGAVDRAWFERCFKQLGGRRWEVVYAAAKYASSGSGHTRARLFADAMLGEVTEKELLLRMSAKRNQDAARALGLVPLPEGKQRSEVVLRRYGALQEMLRTGKKAGGSAKQASEKRAVEIGLENLAWAAGYPDPLRLQWAMEIEQYGDLAEGPVTVTVDGVRVSLAVDEQGVPTLTASKPVKADGPEKELKAVPPAVKKDKRVAVLAERLTDLRRQRSRVRDGLEGAMCRGDEFSGAELAELFGHPLLRPMLSRLVLMGRTSAGGELIGYPDKSGKALRGLDGEVEPVKGGDRLRIAHPLDLLAGKQWHKWQAECFRAERVQPFKQVFREVYVPAAPESRGKGVSTRYDGQQVRPSQALALFGRRGWVARPEEGVQRTFHREGVTVAVAFQESFYTPAEVDGLTLAGLVFRKAGSEEPMEVAKVPARVFSEVMRDVDLVVSVAHRGGVDPEASFSTVEMRAALVRETCALLSLSNVRIESNRAMIKGTLGDYAVHLGSGMITRLPGGLVWVVPVHSQHRGRVFLPFADDDPTTAEVVSKVLLLARDAEIRDPAILSQLRS